MCHRILFYDDDKFIAIIKTDGSAEIIEFAALHLMNNGGGAASVAAFNPFGEYDECTFSVANRYKYVHDGILDPGEDKPVILDVFADQVLVGQFQLENKMQPTTYTVPINKCKQLMFWLECGERVQDNMYYTT